MRMRKERAPWCSPSLYLLTWHTESTTMPPKRSVPARKPFSNKKKKLQLQQKRQKKRERDNDTPPLTPSAEDAGDERGEGSSTETGSEGEGAAMSVSKLNIQPYPSHEGGEEGHYDPNRYKLHFQRESAEEIERRKLRAQREPLNPVSESEMEVGVEDVYRPGSVLDIPHRPPWSYSMSKQQVERQEEIAFQEYLSRIHSSHRPNELSLFEHNLETWRQLWRVLEISDVILLITDIRHPAVHFSPALYTHVVNDLGKKIVLVLNKVDLVPPEVAVAWRHYFISKFPQLKVICFTCFPDHHSTITTPSRPPSSDKVSLKPRKRVRGTLPYAIGSRELFDTVEEMFAGKVDLNSWKQQLARRDGEAGDGSARVAAGEGGGREGVGEGAGGEGGGGGAGGEGGGGDSGLDDSESDQETRQHGERGGVSALHDDTEHNIITIGMVGHPNVGKSSILNGLVGKKMVSTSKTPGHTKHFQTIFLSKSVRLCDCPGLVFPSLVNKQLQIMSGIYPVAQVREPYTAVGYLAERIPLISLLSLHHPDYGKEEGETEEKWTAWSVCDAWAEKRKFYTSKAARLDTYRAANNILRLAVEGRVCMYFRPPGYSIEKEKWKTHPEVKEMIELQRQGLVRSRVSASDQATGGVGVGDGRDGVDPEDSEEREEEGWESDDEGQWSSEGGDKGRNGEEEEEGREDKGRDGEEGEGEGEREQKT